MRMPLGGYRGRSVAGLPPDYIAWCLANREQLRPDLRGAMRRALGKPAPSAGDEIGPVAARFKGGLRSWYRHASLKHHPDRGGSDREQTIVNSCYSDVSSLIDEIGGAR